MLSIAGRISSDFSSNLARYGLPSKTSMRDPGNSVSPSTVSKDTPFSDNYLLRSFVVRSIGKSGDDWVVDDITSCDTMLNDSTGM